MKGHIWAMYENQLFSETAPSVSIAGVLSGFLFFITVHFPDIGEGKIAEVSSADEESHWANSFCTASWASM